MYDCIIINTDILSLFVFVSYFTCCILLFTNTQFYLNYLIWCVIFVSDTGSTTFCSKNLPTNSPGPTDWSVGSPLSHRGIPPQRAPPLLDLPEHSSQYWLPVSHQLHPSCNQTSYWASWTPGWWSPAVLGLVGELNASEPAKVFQDDWQTRPGSVPLQCVLPPTETVLGNRNHFHMLSAGPSCHEHRPDWPPSLGVNKYRESTQFSNMTIFKSKNLFFHQRKFPFSFKDLLNVPQHKKKFD